MTKSSGSYADSDPCWKERQQIYQCMYENNYDKNKCEAFILNGKICKEFWHKVVYNRRSNNIVPHLPGPEEREKIKKEYFEKHQKPEVKLHAGAL